MGLFSKKEEVPSIPTASKLPELPKTDIASISEPAHKLPELPSFPSGSKNTNINQEMVKSAIADIPSPGEEEIHVEIPNHVNVTEEIGGTIPPKPSVEETTTAPMQGSIAEEETPVASTSPIPEPPKKEEPATPATTKPMTKSLNEVEAAPAPAPTAAPTTKPPAKTEQSNEPIFVRIDKFQAAQKNFDHIKEKITEIEEVLKGIKEIKAREEAELKGWTEDVEQIKTRLTEIDNGIFEQI
jgi:hypothetical protein